MPSNQLIGRLWKKFDFKPNGNQRAAILHKDGPLFLPAGPGSGKTRVLLWRVTNLIVARGVDPHAIYLSTFTEKAALQLREGLSVLLAAASEETHKPYDIARMYVGTVHSLCQRMLVERDFQPNKERGKAPVLLDELDQYLFVTQSRNWHELLKAGGFDPEVANELISEYLGEHGKAKHTAASSCIRLFNRLSEECIDARVKKGDRTLRQLLKMYGHYLVTLSRDGARLTDFSLLQEEALNLLKANPSALSVFEHVIVDEYQDTNAVQEQLFFRLASGHKNICVVGDDDQALYRFRGATVENFVQFPTRCAKHLGMKPSEIPLNVNYRSRARIVGFCGDFLKQCDWTRKGKKGGAYRVESKKIRAQSCDNGISVISSTPGAPEAVCSEIAMLVQNLIDTKRVANPNQIAFLYPSLKSAQVKKMKDALEKKGLKVYAPRAGSFLQTPEAKAMLGLFALVLGRPARGEYQGEYARYHDWLDDACRCADGLVDRERLLGTFVSDRKSEIARSRKDYSRLVDYCAARKWNLDAPYNPDRQRSELTGKSGITIEARRRIGSKRFNVVIRKRLDEENPLKLKYVLKRATSVEWSLLDLFYQLTMFEHFARMFDAAQRAENPDEGPVCNLALLTHYISRFLDNRAPLITGDLLQGDVLQHMFFGSYLYALHRRGESEFENAEDPFPKGRIPFLTIHQAKGLEFPVVVLGNPRNSKMQRPIETIVSQLLVGSKDREPLDRMQEFDTMRMFYVALSRAKNLLVIANYKSPGNFMNHEFKSLVAKLPTVPAFKSRSLPAAREENKSAPKIYSYTGDFLAYERCPRQYLVFRKFNFVPSRSQPMMFGSLVHRTLDDIHQHLIGTKS